MIDLRRGTASSQLLTGATGARLNSFGHFDTTRVIRHPATRKPWEDWCGSLGGCGDTTLGTGSGGTTGSVGGGTPIMGYTNVKIDFEDLAANTVLTAQYAEHATFATDATLQFIALGANAAGPCADLNVFQDSAKTASIKVVGNGDPTINVPIDVSAYDRVTRVEVVNTTDFDRILSMNSRFRFPSNERVTASFLAEAVEAIDPVAVDARATSSRARSRWVLAGTTSSRLASLKLRRARSPSSSRRRRPERRKASSDSELRI